MANGQTGNYHLCQWAEDDRILMEEFNADNAAVDAALRANADAVTAKAAETEAKIALVRLLDYTSTAEAASVTVDLSGIDTGAYRELQLYYVGCNTSSNRTGCTFSCTLNHDASAQYTVNGGGMLASFALGSLQNASYGGNVGTLRLLRGIGGRTLLFHSGAYSSIGTTSDSQYTRFENTAGCYHGSSLAAVTAVTFSAATYPVAPGFSITVYGVKA